MTNVTPLLPKKPAPLVIESVTDGDNRDDIVVIRFNRPLTPEEFKFFSETAERTAFLMRGINL